MQNSSVSEKDIFIEVIEKYKRVRRQSEILCEPLLKEDFNLQAMPQVSPTKWHLAHTSWFFETFLLCEFMAGYKPHHPLYEKLFNSYYVAINTPFPRAERGLLSRPTIHEVYEYRRAVDDSIIKFLSHVTVSKQSVVASRIELGLNHEQQHQELILTDIKYNFSRNPLRPAYCKKSVFKEKKTAERGFEWIEHKAGVTHMGASTTNGFCFDNETPHHRVLIETFCIADRLINNAEYLEFIEAGAYQRSEFWLADGWQKCQEGGWQAPLYWQRIDGRWHEFTLYGLQLLNPCEPVCHVSFYEADAYARWQNSRLPTEAEWERAAKLLPVEGHFICDGVLHPRAACANGSGPRQMFGDVWEWTGSAYAAYPGFITPSGAIGEYNAKFMSNQMVLRGGSCISEREHLRATYRNFFYPEDRWQFSGIRLARSKSHAHHG